MSSHETIAHYRITAKLGEGGIGDVWRATDTKNRDVAIKILPEAAQNAPPDVLASGISQAFRSGQTPPFSEKLSNLFSHSDPNQRPVCSIAC